MIVKNETAHDVTITPKTVIAELSAVQQIVAHKSDTNVPDSVKDKNNSSPDLQFDFGDSPLSADWKERVPQTLKSMPEVFAHHDLDFGHVGQVKHHIRLHDQTPFKQRARPIHPQDVDAVRKHLRELLDAGVIRKSESPFASPIVVVRKRVDSIRLCIDYRKLNSDNQGRLCPSQS